MSRPRYDALLSLGSNIDPGTHVPRVVAWLEARFDVVAVSPHYRSAAVGGAPGQPDFINLAVRLETDLPPRALREVTRRAEEICHRRRTPDRYAPRTMDVDLVLFGDRVADFGTWRLPDPQLTTQAFVLVPCADVAPESIEPVSGRTLGALCEALDPTQRATLALDTPG